MFPHKTVKVNLMTHHRPLPKRSRRAAIMQALQDVDYLATRKKKTISRGFVTPGQRVFMHVDFKGKIRKEMEEASSIADQENASSRSRSRDDSASESDLRSSPEKNSCARAVTVEQDFFLMVSEEQFSRVVALALAGAVACRSAEWTFAFAFALVSSDVRLRDRLQRFFGGDMDKSASLPKQVSTRRTETKREKELTTAVDAALLTNHPLAKFCGKWVFDMQRSDSPVNQLEALGVPWAARIAAARSARNKRISLNGPNEWVEATQTAMLPRSTQTLPLNDEDTGHSNLHPVDRSTVIVWSAVGHRPKAGPPPDDDTTPVPPDAPDAVVSVMLYKRNGAVATIIRFCEENHQIYHVVNDLATPIKGSTNVKHLVTHSYFKRVPE